MLNFKYINAYPFQMSKLWLVCGIVLSVFVCRVELR